MPSAWAGIAAGAVLAVIIPADVARIIFALTILYFSADLYLKSTTA